ncbi:MAG: hypothetical protein S4CHLAM2_14030 [Chlamydiales bacterium]|nr:hypothetical protein [Chlamydiales bacterium]
MIPFRKSIGFRLLGISFILLAFPLLVDSFILVQKRYEHAVADAKGYLVEVAHLRELPLEQIQPLNKPLLEVMTYFLNLQTDFPDQTNQELNKRLATLAEVGDFFGIFLLKITDDKEYIVTASSLESYIGKNYTEFFKYDPIQPDSVERGFKGYISFDAKDLDPYFIVAHLVHASDEEKAIGVLAVSDNISDKLNEILQQDDHRYPVRFALLLPSSIVIAATDPELRFNHFLPLDPDFRARFLKENNFVKGALPENPLKVVGEIGYPFTEFEWKGETQIGYVKKLPEADFALLTYASKDEIFHSPVVSFFNIYSVYGLILIIGGIVAYLLTMRMARPIQNLSVVMQEIQKGDSKQRYQKDPMGFEINVLGSIFNEMVDALLEQKKVAEEERIKRETFAQELRLGQQVQRSLLPQQMPHYPGVEVAEVYIPAIEVGGDFYDVFVKETEEGASQLVVAVADASGKGVQACFYSLSVRNMLRTYMKEYDDVGRAVSDTNNLFTLDTEETGMFVTVMIGVYDKQTGLFHYFSAGHNPPIVRRANGAVEIMRHHGMAMGVLPTENQQAESIQLHSGDVVVLYTDGITEAHDEEFELYSEERLIQLIENEGEKSASALVRRIVADVNDFAGKAPQHDDITLLVMKIE